MGQLPETPGQVLAEKGDVQLLVFSVGQEEFALELTEVREIVKRPEITPVPNMPSAVKGVANLRGKVLTVIELADLLGVHGDGPVPEVKNDQPHPATERDGTKKHDHHSSSTSPQYLIIAEKGDELFGLLVDSAEEILRTFKEHEKATPDLLKQSPAAAYIRTVVVLENDNHSDARLILRLDLPAMLANFTAASSSTSL